MDDDIDGLKAKIQSMQGKINHAKQYQQPRYAPYSRGPRAGYAAPVRNRTLVLNGANSTTDPSPSHATLDPQTNNFIATHPHQLVNKSTLERRQQHKEQLRTARRQKTNQKERAALAQHTAGGRELLIEGIRFQLRDDGSKLVRISDPVTASRISPKTFAVAGIPFHRTKNGNLVRANAVKILTRPGKRTVQKQCEHFTKTGKCPYGRDCRFAHDPEKVAICPAFLKNKCTASEYCDLSHVMSINRVPACIHFLRGNCTNDACRYPHVNTSPSAPVCVPFARLGYCSNDSCEQRHVFECPDFANNGECANTKCSLPHPVRAHVLRKAAAKQAKVGSEEESDVSSDEDNNDNGFEDIDSDDADDILMGEDGDYGHNFTQQQDFVAL